MTDGPLLRACPLCAGTATFRTAMQEGEADVTLGCSKCGLALPTAHLTGLDEKPGKIHDTLRDLAGRWNRRFA